MLRLRSVNAHPYGSPTVWLKFVEPWHCHTEVVQRCIATVWYGHTGAVGIRVALRQQSTGRPLDTSYRVGLFSVWREGKKGAVEISEKAENDSQERLGNSWTKHCVEISCSDALSEGEITSINNLSKHSIT